MKQCHVFIFGIISDLISWTRCVGFQRFIGIMSLMILYFYLSVLFYCKSSYICDVLIFAVFLESVALWIQKLAKVCISRVEREKGLSASLLLYTSYHPSICNIVLYYKQIRKKSRIRKSAKYATERVFTK